MANGTIIEDPVRFPSKISALADAVHARGLRFGLYTSASSLTCQQRPGSYNFEAVDAERYCYYGADYIKVDNCGGARWPRSNTSWIAFRAAIDACAAAGGRSLVLSVEYCDAGSGDDCAAWIAGVADLWRTSGDVQANFASIVSNLDRNNANAAAQRPGKYGDPDMIVAGLAGVSLAEAQTQFGAWALVAAPILLSVDLTQPLPPGVLEIVSNPEVIAVSHDAAQVQGVRVSPAAPGAGECWARPLADGAIAALLVNRGAAAADVACSWAELGLKQPAGAAAVRDLWRRADLGSFSGGFTASALAPHASMLVKVTQQ